MQITGKVSKGVQVGSKFGVATANLSFDERPDLEEGVYLVDIQLPDTSEPVLNGIMHFGERKTFGSEFSTEIHILDFEEDIYEAVLTVSILKKVREVTAFANADALFTQIEADIIGAEKFFCRRTIKSQWAALSPNKRTTLSQKALLEIEKMPEFQSATVIYAYAPDGQEIDFVEKLWKKHSDKTWCFPRVDKEKMTFHQVDSYDELKPGYLNLLEPSLSQVRTPESPDLILVPAVAVAKTKGRLGRGGGFYDQFLVNSSAYKVSVLPDFAVLEEIPCESHDQNVDKFIKIY